MCFRPTLSAGVFSDTIAIFRMPVLTGRLSIRGDLEERYVATLGAAKGTSLADLRIPYRDCLIAVVSGDFPPDGGREALQGEHAITITRGRLSLISQTRIKQFELPSGEYLMSCKLYQERRDSMPDLVVLLRRNDRLPIALLRSRDGLEGI